MNDKIISIFNHYFHNDQIDVTEAIEKAALGAIQHALQGVRVEGKPENIQVFKEKLPEFAERYNVKIIEE